MAAVGRRSEGGDPCLADAVGDADEAAVDEERSHDDRATIEQPESEVPNRKTGKPDCVHTGFGQTIGKHARGVRDERHGEVEEHVHQQHRGDRVADLVQPQQQKGIGEVHERDHTEQRGERSHLARQRNGVRGCRFDNGSTSAGLADSEGEQDAERCRDHGDPQGHAQVVVRQGQDEQADGWPDDGAKVVCCAVETENAPELFTLHTDGEQCIPWCTSHAFADAINDAP